MGDPGDSPDVGDGEGEVPRGFDMNQLSVGPHRRTDRFGIPSVHDGSFDIEFMAQ
jgi:hypothetical protein